MGTTQLRSREPTREVFVIPDTGDEYIIYAPLRGRIFRGNAAFVNHLVGMLEPTTTEAAYARAERLIRLEQLDLLEDEAERAFLDHVPSGQFAPTDVTIIPTTACNLRCKYCFASSGDPHRPGGIQRIDPSAARAAIELVIDNARKVGVNTCHVSFRGGGEPLTMWRLLADLVERGRAYAANHLPRVNLHVSVLTNGYADPKAIKWVANSMDRVAVSFDGPPDIQDDQRPLANHRPTFERVLSTIKELRCLGVPELAVRATVSDPYVRRVPEIARFLCESLPVDEFMIAPVVLEGRCFESGLTQPDLDLFAEQIVIAQEIAASFGKRVDWPRPAEVFWDLRRTYCPANTPSFTLMPSGIVSACSSVDLSDQRSSIFHFGTCDAATGKFQFDPDAVDRLRRWGVESFQQCRDCFAKYHCVGGCLKDRLSVKTGEGRDADVSLCDAKRQIVKTRLLEALSTHTTGAEFSNT